MENRAWRKRRFILESRPKVTRSAGPAPAPVTGVVLVGRGSLYSRQPSAEVSALAEYLRSADAGWVVADAMLEQGGPSLPGALSACSEAGAEKVVVLPAFIPLETATRNWLRFVARRWQEHTATPVQVVLAEPLGGHDAVADAAVGLVRKAMQSASPVGPVGHKPGTPVPDWSVIPPHDHHVLFCHGPRCTAAGAAELGAFLRKRLKEEGMDEGPNHVLAARSGCLYPCNLGPVMVVYPEGIWYCGLDESVLSQIIEQHFREGEPVSSHAFRPSPVPQSLPRSERPESDISGEVETNCR